MSSSNDGCLGCSTSNVVTHDNHCMLSNVDSTCPCGSCLVKMMCFTMCDLLIEHRNKACKSKAYKLAVDRRKRDG